jgi:hypothetical protein
VLTVSVHDVADVGLLALVPQAGAVVVPEVRVT